MTGTRPTDNPTRGPAAPAPAAPPPRAARAFARAWEHRHGIATFVLLFVAWEFLARRLGVPEYLLPPPSTIAREIARRWPRVADNVWSTTIEIVLGFVVAVLVSIPLALAIANSRFIEKTAYPVIVFLQIIPKIAIAPLFVIWFGIGITPRVLIVFLLCFFPIVIASIAGFRSVRPEIVELARSTGAGRWLMFRKISVPAALPSIFTGLKVAAALAATAAVVSEFVASDRGLGYLLLEFQGDLNTPMVFGIIVLLSFIGLVVYYLVELIERLAIPWHVSQRGNGTTVGTM
jgi:NitT/TauT family transport system permease protein